MVITFLLLPKNQAEPVKHLGQFSVSANTLAHMAQAQDLRRAIDARIACENALLSSPDGQCQLTVRISHADIFAVSRASHWRG